MDYLKATLKPYAPTLVQYVYSNYIESTILLSIQILMFKLLTSIVIQLTLPQTSFIFINACIAFTITKFINYLFGTAIQSEYLRQYNYVREFICKSLNQTVSVIAGPYGGICMIGLVIIGSHIIVAKTNTIVISMALELAYGYITSIPVKSIQKNIENRIVDASTERRIRKSIPERISQKEVELKQIDEHIVEFAPLIVECDQIDTVVNEFYIPTDVDLLDTDFIEL